MQSCVDIFLFSFFSTSAGFCVVGVGGGKVDVALRFDFFLCVSLFCVYCG